MKIPQQVKQKLDFSGDSIYVGIDVHKKQWNVFIMSDYKEHKGFVQPPDPGALASYLRKNFPGARRCKGRIKSMLNLYGIDHSFKGWTKAFFKWLLELRLAYPNGTFTLHALVEELQSIEDLKKKVGRQIRSGIVKDEKYAKLIELLCRIPGIGLIGAITILTELGNMKRFRNCDHLCSYVGLVPTLHSSDVTEYIGNLTPRGNTYVLPILIECTWAAVGKDPALMNAYHQLCKRMKGQDAIIRIARKLLRRIRHVLMYETPYELNTVSQCMQVNR